MSFSQKCDRVLFTGKALDTLRPQNFYNLMVINHTTGQGVFGQPNGYFSVYVSNGDSLSVSVKDYMVVNLVVVEDSNCQFIQKIYLERKSIEIREVTIHPLKSLEQIKEERENLAMRETRMVTGIDVMQSPITALYQAFSKKEQNKRWIAEQEYKDDQRKVVRELLRLYVSYDIIALNEDEFDQFISFLNINETFLKTATEMELVTFIQDKFDHFKMMNQMQTIETPKWRITLESDKKLAVIELLNMYISNHAIDLPESEFDHFIIYLNIDENFLKSGSDLDVFNFIRSKYFDFIDFYKIDMRLVKEHYNITEEDNSDWKWDLEHNKGLKAAIVTLLKMYNAHRVIQLDEEEFDKFIIFLNLKESFLLSASNDQLIQFTREKYYKYLDFYKK